jgi:hypothetical protein
VNINSEVFQDIRRGLIAADRTITRRYAMRIVPLLAVGLLALVPSLAPADDTLVKFDGGIGADGVSNALGSTAVAAAVTRNIVRGVQPPAQLWRVADFNAAVKADGRITAVGRGLVFAGGDTVGTALVVTSTGGTAGLNVFATLICENVAPFIERNTKSVPLAANGDFKIDDVLSPPPSSSCATPVLLIRNAANLNWFLAGIQQFDQ